MSEPAAPRGAGVAGPVLIAAVLSLAIVVLRLYGELNIWDPKYFSTEAGGGQSLLGITWLVPLFGFWFGRRLAQGGHRPKSTGLALAMCVAGAALAAAIGWVSFGTELLGPADDLVTKVNVFFPATAVCGLLLLVAWPRAWTVLAIYGVLARIPVIVIQYLAFARGWHTHFNAADKKHPMDDATLNHLLLLAQGLLWPFGFTVLVGGLFATIGALTVRRS